MLKYRLMTAAILLPIVLGIILYAPRFVFSGLVALLLILGFFEWLFLAKVNSYPLRGLSFLLFLIGVFIFSLFYPFFLYVLPLCWLLALHWIRRYPSPIPILNSKVFLVGLGIFLLLSLWFSLNCIENISGRNGLLYFLCLVWMTDTSAYFVGKRYGRTPLAPLISPKKTVAGFWGAMLFSLVIFALGFASLSWIREHAFYFFVLSIVTVLASVVGDLFESLLKRISNIKDSGYLLPGHGGVLDRIDSMIAAAPFFAVGLLLLGN